MAADHLVLHTRDTAETMAVGRAVAGAARDAGVDSLFLDVRGELGAGKTVFVRGLAMGLGLASEQAVASPTFTIARSYALAGPVFRALHHIDAYRLGSTEELDAAGFEDMWGPGLVTSVEWGERVEEALPMDRLEIALATAPEGPAPAFDATEAAREIRLRALGPDCARVLERLARRRAGEARA